MKCVLFSAVIFVSTLGSVHAAEVQSNNAAGATRQIQQVVQDFQTGIIKKDGGMLSNLFLPGSNSWFGVMTDAAREQFKKQFPGAGFFQPGNYMSFIDYVVGNPDPVEEKFSNVKIHTDGNIGAVYFDFLFLDNGKVNNKGSETWQLVRTPNGWKINSIIYTVDPEFPKSK